MVLNGVCVCACATAAVLSALDVFLDVSSVTLSQLPTPTAALALGLTTGPMTSNTASPTPECGHTSASGGHTSAQAGHTVSQSGGHTGMGVKAQGAALDWMLAGQDAVSHINTTELQRLQQSLAFAGSWPLQRLLGYKGSHTGECVQRESQRLRLHLAALSQPPPGVAAGWPAGAAGGSSAVAAAAPAAASPAAVSAAARATVGLSPRMSAHIMSALSVLNALGAPPQPSTAAAAQSQQHQRQRSPTPGGGPAAAVGAVQLSASCDTFAFVAAAAGSKDAAAAAAGSQVQTAEQRAAGRRLMTVQLPRLLDWLQQTAVAASDVLVKARQRLTVEQAKPRALASSLQLLLLESCVLELQLLQGELLAASRAAAVLPAAAVPTTAGCSLPFPDQLLQRQLRRLAAGWLPDSWLARQPQQPPATLSSWQRNTQQRLEQLQTLADTLFTSSGAAAAESLPVIQLCQLSLPLAPVSIITRAYATDEGIQLPHVCCKAMPQHTTNPNQAPTSLRVAGLSARHAALAPARAADEGAVTAAGGGSGGGGSANEVWVVNDVPVGETVTVCGVMQLVPTAGEVRARSTRASRASSRPHTHGSRPGTQRGGGLGVGHSVVSSADQAPWFTPGGLVTVGAEAMMSVEVVSHMGDTHNGGGRSHSDSGTALLHMQVAACAAVTA